MKILKSAYSTLRDWFDPSLEGSPYDEFRRTAQSKKRTQKHSKSWLNRRWVKLSV